MDLLDHNRRMAANNRWSNDRLYRAVLALKPGEFEATRVSFFPSIKETLNHIVGADLLLSRYARGRGDGRDCFRRVATTRSVSPKRRSALTSA